MWERLATLEWAEDISRSRTPRNPWAGIGPFSHRNRDDEFEQLHLVEVLGWADRVYVCGDVSRIGSNGCGAAGQPTPSTQTGLLAQSDPFGIKRRSTSSRLSPSTTP